MKPTRQRRGGASVAALLFFCFISMQIRAGTVATDGTLGHVARSLTGPHFSVGPKLGQQRGGNLFHSFNAFTLDKGETATFTGPASVRNIFARITGGPAIINGTLACPVPQANFYLIDPAGVTFGRDANLDLRGSFAVTTADTIKLGANGSFDVSHPAASTLTTAPPGAFGFLASRPAGVIIHGAASRAARLAVREGSSVSIVSGPIQVRDGLLVAPAGQINLVAAGSAGQVNIHTTPSGRNSAAGFDSFSRLAKVVLTHHSLVNTDGPAGGGVLIRASDLTLNGSFISSATLGNARGFDVQIVVSGSVRVLGGAAISADTAGQGRGGNLMLSASRLTIDGAANPIPDRFNGLSTDTTSTARRAGPGGDLTVRAGMVRVLAAGEISAGTFGAGRGGALSLSAFHLIIDDRGNRSAQGLTGLATQSNPFGRRGGRAGNLTLRAATVRVLAGGIISADTFGAGHGGDLTLSASELNIDGRGSSNSDLVTGVSADTYSPVRGAGPAGNLTIRAGRVRVLGGGIISANTFGAGHGGDLTLTAHEVTINAAGDPDPRFDTGITANTNSPVPTAAAGNLTMHAGRVRVLGGAVISASTQGPGTGGSVIVSAGSLLVDGTNTLGGQSKIAAVAVSSGAAGGITVSGHRSIIVSRGGILTSLSSFSDAGDVHVSSERRILLDGGAISAQAKQSGGSVSVSTPLFLQLRDGSSIVTNSTAANGGNIKLNALELTLEQSRISANAPLGNGGNIAIAADSTPGLVATGPLARRNLTATGAAGISGNVQTGPANSDIARSLARLPVDLQPAALTLQPQCGQMLDVISTFLIQGRGSVVQEPGFWQGDFDLGIPPASR